MPDYLLVENPEKNSARYSIAHKLSVKHETKANTLTVVDPNPANNRAPSSPANKCDT